MLLNLSCDLKKHKSIIWNQVKPKLHSLCEITGIKKIMYGYFIRGVITWAAKNGAPPLLLHIFGRWTSDSYKIYITYSRKNLAQLSFCASRLMLFQNSRLVQQYLSNPTGCQFHFIWERWCYCAQTLVFFT